MARTALTSPLVETVCSLFAETAKLRPDGSNLPPIVLENRQRRAFDRVAAALESRGSEQIPAELSAEVEQLLARWAREWFDDGFRPMEAFEVRCANERELVLARQSGDQQQILAALQRDLRRRIVERFGRIEIRGIQTSQRVLLELERIFIPLHVEAPFPSDGPKRGLIAIPWLRTAVTDVLRQRPRLLIGGAPGSGKTTLVAWLATRLSGGNLATQLGWDRNVVPLVLTVREFTSPSITPKHIARLNATEPELIQHLVAHGRAVLLVDGLDEVPAEFREKIIGSLQLFCRKYPSVPVVVTSRPMATVEGGEATLADFELVRLAALSREETEEFVDKWCLAAEESLNRDIREARARASEAAEDLKQRIARSRPIQRLVETPLIASIVCIVHRFLGQRIPEHRVALYEKCTDVLLYEWDKAKLPAGSLIGDLTAPQKRALLAGLARRMHEARQTELPDEEVRCHFAAKLPGLGYRAEDAPRIVEEIRDRSGLLVERRPGYFAFSHLIFQEYLTAFELVQSPQANWADGLVDRYEDPSWQEVIVLAAGMTGVDAGKLISSLLAKGDAGVFLAAHCLETAIEVPLAVRKEVQANVAKRLPPKNPMEALDLCKLGPLVSPILAKLLLTANLTANDTALAIVPLHFGAHETAIPVLVRLVTDLRVAQPGFIVGGLGERFLVADFASVALLWQAARSPLAKRAAHEVIRTLPANHLRHLRELFAARCDAAPRREDSELVNVTKELLTAIDERLKDRSPDKPRSKRGVRSG